MSKKMQVTVTIKLDVDMEEWSTMYGTQLSDSAIRSDVKSYVASTVREQLEMSGLVESGVRYSV